MIRKSKKERGWFTEGGFEKDPTLSEEDKRYYRKQLDKDPKEKKSHKENWL